MPLYEYKCHSCGTVFEVIQKFSDRPLSAHENCGGELERLISPSVFQFKGTGWYVTDYPKRSNGKDDPTPPALKESDKGKDKTEPKASKSPSEPAAKK
jgi:putative FmdB family regulatory protein